MFYIEEPSTKVLIPLEDAEIIGECPICGKTFPFPELWEMFDDDNDFTIWDSAVLCDKCGHRTSAIRKVLTDAGIPEEVTYNTTVVTKLIQAITND